MLQPYHFHFTCGHSQISEPDRIPVDGIENHKRRCIQCEPNTLSARVLWRGLKVSAGQPWVMPNGNIVCGDEKPDGAEFAIKWVAGVMVKV